MPSFARAIGVDYSGAQTPTSSLPGLRVFCAEGASEPYEVLPPPSPRKYFTRIEVAQWLLERLREDVPTLVGVDHSFSFPIEYFKKYQLPRDWPSFLDDFCWHWPTDDENMYVDFVREDKYGLGAARVGNLRGRGSRSGAAGPSRHSISTSQARWRNQPTPGCRGSGTCGSGWSGGSTSGRSTDGRRRRAARSSPRSTRDCARFRRRAPEFHPGSARRLQCRGVAFAGGSRGPACPLARARAHERRTRARRHRGLDSRRALMVRGQIRNTELTTRSVFARRRRETSVDPPRSM